MHQLFVLLTLFAYIAASGCLLLYRKQGARHRHNVSWLAWALLVVLGGSAINLMLNPKEIGLFETAQAILLSLFVFGARGNVARLFWSVKNVK